MALLHIPLEQIDEQQLQRLIQAKAQEARDIEYKRETYGGSDRDHAEWLADVSSFANTAGGDLVIGMDAKQGVPTAVTPLAIDLDQEILRLEQIARSNLQPRIAQLAFKPVPISSGGRALVVRIPRSFNPPHRIVRQGAGHNRFWARSSAGKYEPNVDELRALFTLAPQLLDRVRDFRLDRIAKVVARATPVTLLDQSCLILHVIPLSSFDPGASLDLPSIDRSPHAFAPIGSASAMNWRVNFDGVLTTSNADQRATGQRAYTQVYRTGRIEAVNSGITMGDRPEGAPARLTSIRVEGQTLITLVRYLKALQALGVEPPFAVSVSLIGLKGVHINVGVQANWADDDNIAVLTEDQYHFAEVILDTVPMSIQECAVMIRPSIEQLANTAGRSASSSFGPDGSYLHAFR